MKELKFNDILSSLTHIRGGIPPLRLSARVRLAEHSSIFFGPSQDIFDIQEYDPERDQPDQIIPWLIGPKDEIYSRRCVEHHEVKVILLADLSSSISAGVDFRKRRLFLESLGFIGLTAARYQDPIGLIGFTDRVVLNLPARCGQNNFFHLLRMVYDFLAEGDLNVNKNKFRRKTDLFAALDFVRRSFGTRCFIPVISDFVGFEEIVSSSVLRTVASRHELIFIFLDDPSELVSASGLGFVKREDIETGKLSIVSRSKLIKNEKNLRANRKEIRKELRGLGVQSVVLEPGKHFNRLFRFFYARHKSRVGRR